ncbi:hypothetical protein, partial [Lysobacter sp. A3-1-A15]|uniref:hypothetical protein n=1 Tax=Novilysobacter viscosus TaxID=3098602 RepID=UPI002ED782E4
MGVIGADKMRGVAGQALRARPDVALDVADQVAQVQRAVGVGQGAGDDELAGHGTIGWMKEARLSHAHDRAPAVRLRMLRRLVDLRKDTKKPGV